MADSKEFRPCVGVEGYEVSEAGEVRNEKTGYVRKPTLSNGYLRVRLNQRTFYVQRLVAQAWLPPPEEGQTDVNHKDRDRQNNCAENLEWVSPAENNRHARATGHVSKTRGKAIESIDVEGVIVRYCSIREASRALGVAFSGISKVMNLPGRSCKGLHWRTCDPTELPEEEWRDLRGHFGLTFIRPYAVSSLGRMKGPRGVMHGRLTDDGYIGQQLFVISNGETRPITLRVSRCVATVFLGPAPSKHHVVDHIDEDRSNNAYTNLRWATQQQNAIFALGRSVAQLTKDGAVAAKFDSISLAAQAVKHTSNAIYLALKRGGTSAGFRWEYA